MDLLDAILNRSKPVVKAAPTPETSIPQTTAPFRAPTPQDVPAEWTGAIMGPGMPIAPIMQQKPGLRGQIEASEPRSFQYVPQVNATLSPRSAYPLMPFSQLLHYGENIPEPATFRRMITEELKTLTPTVIGPDGVSVDMTDLSWMTRSPDRKNKHSVWLSRFEFNVQTYDAVGLYRIRNTGPYKALQDELHKLTVGRALGPFSHWTCEKCGATNRREKKSIKISVAEMDGEAPTVRDADQDSFALYCTNCSAPLPKDQYARYLIEFANKDGNIFEKMTRYPLEYADRLIEYPVKQYSADLHKIETVTRQKLQKVATQGDNKIIGLRIIDGSTLMPLIDERGELPAPPAPAFTQIIWGQPQRWLTTEELWYEPRNLRADAPYGISPIEDAFRAVQYLDNLWTYESAQYVEGTVPEMLVETPDGWDPQRTMEFERTWNSRMAGQAAEKRRIRFVPHGVTVLATKSAPWNSDGYKTALETVAHSYGITQSELGNAPGKGLGGKGFQDKGEQTFFRLGLGPNKSYVEAPFNDALWTNGYLEYEYELGFGSEEIDPEKQAVQVTADFVNGGIMRDEYREARGYDKVGGDAGSVYLTPAGKTTDASGGANLPKPPQEGQLVQPAKPEAEQSAPTVVDETPQEQEANVPEDGAVTKLLGMYPALAKHCGVCDEDDDYYGAPVAEVIQAEFPIQGANDTHVVAMMPRNLESRPALWKDAKDEAPELREWIGGPLYPREEAAYLMDRAMEMYLVPVAYVATVNEQVGAIAHYVKHIQPLQEVSAYDPKWIEAAAVLDFVNGQVDRRNHNWGTHPEDPKRPILYDNGLSFPTTALPIGSAFAVVWAGKAISPRNLNQLILASNNNALWKDLTALVGAEAVKISKARINLLLETGMFPGGE